MGRPAGPPQRDTADGQTAPPGNAPPRERRRPLTVTSWTTTSGGYPPTYKNVDSEKRLVQLCCPKPEPEEQPPRAAPRGDVTTPRLRCRHRPLTTREGSGGDACKPRHGQSEPQAAPSLLLTPPAEGYVGRRGYAWATRHPSPVRIRPTEPKVGSSNLSGRVREPASEVGVLSAWGPLATATVAGEARLPRGSRGHVHLSSS